MAIICPYCGTDNIMIERKNGKETVCCLNSGCNHTATKEEFTKSKKDKRKVHLQAYGEENNQTICGTVTQTNKLLTTKVRNEVTCQKCLALMGKLKSDDSMKHTKSRLNWKMIIACFFIIIFSFLIGLKVGYSSEQKTIKNVYHNHTINIKNPDKTNTHKNMTVTAYTPSQDETDNTPNKTTLMTKPISGWTCAISRDLASHLGDKVWIKKYGIRKITDLMNKRFEDRIDLFVGNKNQAREIGKQKLKVIFIE